MKRWLQLAVIVALISLLYLFLTQVVVFYVVVDGHSMEPTYHNADVVAMSKIPLWIHGPRKGDVVLIREFNEFGKGDGKLDIKRISGVKGDSMVINGFVYVLGPTSYFVRGDNTNKGASFDSRSYGALPRSQILAVALKSH